MYNNNENRDALILKWQNSVNALAEAKELEKELRLKVLSQLFSFEPEVLREGTENFELGSGFKLKSVFKISRRLAKKEDVEKALQKIEKCGPEGEFIAERLVSWKPELSISEYRKLPEKLLRIINDVVISSEATPSLELVSPKSK